MQALLCFHFTKSLFLPHRTDGLAFGASIGEFSNGVFVEANANHFCDVAFILLRGGVLILSGLHRFWDNWDNWTVIFCTLR